MTVKFSAVAVVFGSTADRYVLGGYTPQRTLEEMLDDAAKVPGLTGIHSSALRPVSERRGPTYQKRGAWPSFARASAKSSCCGTVAPQSSRKSALKETMSFAAPKSSDGHDTP